MAKNATFKVRVRVKYAYDIEVSADCAEDAERGAVVCAIADVPDNAEGVEADADDAEVVLRSLEVNPAAKWVRYRFVEESGETRPYLFSPRAPYWCSGYDSNDNPIIVAWLPEGESVERVWCKPVDITEYETVDAPTFTSRFPRPSWYVEA